MTGKLMRTNVGGGHPYLHFKEEAGKDVKVTLLIKGRDGDDMTPWRGALETDLHSERGAAATAESHGADAELVGFFVQFLFEGGDVAIPRSVGQGPEQLFMGEGCGTKLIATDADTDHRWATGVALGFEEAVENRTPHTMRVATGVNGPIGQRTYSI